MLRIAIVDDEKYMLQSIANILQQNGAEVTAQFTRSNEALNWLKENYQNIDALFLDISMPVINGFALADVVMKLDERLPVVFITAHDAYAVQAFEKSALDYILKPATVERVARTLQRISVAKSHRTIVKSKVETSKTKLGDMDRDELWEKKKTRSALLKKLAGDEYNDKTLLFRESCWEWVDKNSVSSFSKDKTVRYVKVLANGLEYETVESLAEFLENFDKKQWLTCYRAMYVKIAHIEKIERDSDGAYLVLKNHGSKIPVSRGYLEEVILKLND